MRVVIADDDLTQRSYLSAIVERAGHEPIVTDDTHGALAALAESRSSLLISDIEMPGPDGLELVRHIRGRQLDRYVYIILVTGRDQPGDLIAGLAAGADDFIAKPVDPSVMLVRLKGAERLLKYDRDLSERSTRLADAKTRLEDDLKAAAAAQRWLLPPSDIALNSCRIRTMFAPSRIVSGDVFDYFRIDGQRIGFYAADVAGHGVHAAFLAGAVAHLIHPGNFAALAVDGHEAHPRHLVEDLNRRFAARIAPDEFLTMTAGVIDESNDTLTFCQAGHPHPLILAADGEARWLGTGGYPVGLFPESTYEDVTVPFAVGDQLVVYSDGVVEPTNDADEAYGERRLADLLASLRGAPSEALATAVKASLAEWTGQDSFADDLSVIVFDRGDKYHDIN